MFMIARIRDRKSVKFDRAESNRVQAAASCFGVTDPQSAVLIVHARSNGKEIGEEMQWLLVGTEVLS